MYASSLDASRSSRVMLPPRNTKISRIKRTSCSIYRPPSSWEKNSSLFESGTSNLRYAVSKILQRCIMSSVRCEKYSTQRSKNLQPREPRDRTSVPGVNSFRNLKQARNRVSGEVTNSTLLDEEDREGDQSSIIDPRPRGSHFYYICRRSSWANNQGILSTWFFGLRSKIRARSRGKIELVNGTRSRQELG